MSIVSILKAKQRLTGLIDEQSVEDKQWLSQVKDSVKMFEVVQQLWLTLQHFGEACLRTGVEIVCDRRTRKLALMPGLTEDCQSEFKRTVNDKAEIVINAAKLKETAMGKVRALKDELLSCKADFKAKEQKLEDELKQVKEALSNYEEIMKENMRQAGKKEERVPGDATQRSALKDLQKKYAELEEMYANLQKATDAKEVELSSMKRQLTEEGIDKRKSNESQVADLLTNVVSLEDKLKKLAEENRLLKAASQSNSAEVDNTSMKNQKDELQELAELKKSLQEAKQALSESEKRRDHAEARARVANDECENLRENLAASNGLAIDDPDSPHSAKAVRAENDSLQGENSNLREANKDFRDKLEQMEAALAAAQEALAASQEALVTAQQVPQDELEPTSGLTTHWEEECEEVKRELKKIKKERDKQIQANMDLEHEVHTLKTALHELEMKVRDLSDLASKGGEAAAAEMKKYLDRSGLSSVFESWNCRDVYKRLYMDFWNRCKRMDELRAKLAPEHWESTQPSRRLITASPSPSVLPRRAPAPQLMPASADRPSHSMIELQRPQYKWEFQHERSNFDTREVHLGFSTPEKVSNRVQLHSTEMVWPRSPQTYGGGFTKWASQTDPWAKLDKKLIGLNVDLDKNPSDVQEIRPPLLVQSPVKKIKSGLTKGASKTNPWTNVDLDKNSVSSDVQGIRSPQSPVKQVKNAEGLTSELTAPFLAPGDAEQQSRSRSLSLPSLRIQGLRRGPSPSPGCHEGREETLS